jgi:hypothetical protein
MNLCCFLLLLLVLSGLSESLQHTKPPDVLHTTGVTVCANGDSAKLGVLAPVLPQNEVCKIVLYHNMVLPTSSEVLNLTPSGVFKFVAANCRLFDNVKTTASILGVKSSKKFISIFIHGGKKLCWAIRILLECLQHVLKMYTWSLSENLPSVQFKCRLVGLSLKQSLF